MMKDFLIRLMEIIIPNSMAMMTLMRVTLMIISWSLRRKMIQKLSFQRQNVAFILRKKVQKRK